MGVDALLERSAARLPDKIAVVCGHERRSYRQLDEQANRLAHALIDEGLTQGERVAICLGDPLQVVVSLFAVLKAGGVFFVVNPRARADDLAHLLADSGAWGLIADSLQVRLKSDPTSTDGTICRWDPASAGLKTFTRCDAPDAPATAPDKRHHDSDLAALVYTSGSTGRSKGVMLTHRNLLSAATAICQYLENTSDDVILNALPLWFTYGLGQVTTAFHAGATVVLERPTYPAAFVETIARERVTGLPLVPTLATLLLQQDLRSREFPDLRYITNAAAALSVPKIRQLRQTFPRVRIYSMYGQTECQRASYLPAEQIDSRPTSVGIAIPGTEAWIVDDRGARVPPGVAGELVVRGPHVMSGYWRQPEETARALRPGPLPEEVVLYTGDLFRMAPDGFLYFVDRKDDVIKTRGEKVAPRQVEEVIARLSGVAEVSVYGVPDEVLGEAIVASVTLSPGSVLSGAMIQRHCLKHLDAYMVPQTIDIRDALPTTSSGKVSRRMLRGMMHPAEKVCG